MSKQPRQIETHFEFGRNLHAAGRTAEAEQVYRQVLAAAPQHAEAMHLLGVLATESGRAAEGLSLLDRAIAARPSTAIYHVSRANVLLALRRPDDAIAAAKTALRYKQSTAEAHQVLGHAFSDLGQAEAAIAAYGTALRQRPSLPNIHNDLGAALRLAGRLEEAEKQLLEGIRRDPGDPAVLLNLSSVLKEAGRAAEAEARLRAVLRMTPGDPVALYNLGLLLLLKGSFKEGWSGFEYRFAAGAVPERRFAQPQWRGDALDGRVLLVHAEQGLGDCIQFSRYLSAIEGTVLFEAPPRLIRLLSSLPRPPQFIPAGASPPRFDAVCPLLSLPGRMGLTETGAAVPYLRAEPEKIAFWRARLGSRGFRIGIVWQGNPNRHEDKGRSLSIAHFHALTEVKGVRLISLQKDFGAERVTELPEVETLGPDFDAGPDAFTDSAAVIANLDLVITSDTAMAHLAGALGCPVWVALRHVPDWRWMLDRPDSPWYPGMRLFRQPSRGDWAPVFAAMAAELNAMTLGGDGD